MGKYDLPAEFKVYDRYYPTYGGPEDSPTYLGKLVPGLRASGLPPVPFIAARRAAAALEDGRRRQGVPPHTPVRPPRAAARRLDRPASAPTAACPGPYHRGHPGRHVRIVVHNQLAEPTSVHWHGAELPNNMDGVPGVTQDLIEPGESFVYQFRVHQAGTFFWHAHVAAAGAAGDGRLLHHPPEDRLGPAGRPRLRPDLHELLGRAEHHGRQLLPHAPGRHGRQHVELAHHQRPVGALHHAAGLQARRAGPDPDLQLQHQLAARDPHARHQLLGHRPRGGPAAGHGLA